MERWALLSVSKKTGIVPLAQALHELYGFRLLSSGGTAETLKAEGLPVTKVSEHTSAPEILGGRVKTLHPKIHGGILARLDLPSDLADLANQGIAPISVVVVNLYPFTETIRQPHCTLAEAIEQIDIGGPTLLRAAAKNFAHVAVLSHPSQYDPFLSELATHSGESSLEFRRSLALAAFQQTQTYDAAIAQYLQEPVSGLASTYTLICQQPRPLRYGENPHQPATWYQVGTTPKGWSAATQLQGKELSYNNLLDLEAARRMITEFLDHEPTAVIVKHNNPCGVACGDTLSSAYGRALQADPVSAFGGIVALNRPLDEETATALTETFLECVVVPACVPSAAEILARKPNVRLLVLPDLTIGPSESIRAIAGGILLQKNDDQPTDTQTWEVVTQRQPTAEQWQDLVFAWKVCRHVKSNAIVVALHQQTLGIGAGQTNRVGAAELALKHAVADAVLASDGFLPFDDTVRAAAAKGISAIVQPGGSLRDRDSIAAADQLGIAMIHTHLRHFLH
ncbi:MAG: bifunctional phosphoribosylaminoimidazolecarboxamide formyltransferase/IMP cyclohydrolase [Oscillatoriales cyanobacterium SM2_2_1]|nr:bifunctional phosphoribosylaminoimidazolecarboxamide formyltransferase/IMP cyclohydrolase [Oscillatoriales cyanobacterium SM2_2_1]